ncbi:hypothetical protein ZWY2020_032786 [Hordeum vulgare]|nr:hypothetical protein ZWY2020_032786 [Hordeum vulgare]
MEAILGVPTKARRHERLHRTRAPAALALASSAPCAVHIPAHVPACLAAASERATSPLLQASRRLDLDRRRASSLLRSARFPRQPLLTSPRLLAPQLCPSESFSACGPAPEYCGFIFIKHKGLFVKAP